MAEKLADAIVYLATDDSKLEAGFKAAEGKTRGWAGRVGGIAKAALTGAVVGAGVAAAAAVASVGKAALDVSVDTEKAAADMAASLGIPIAEAERFAEVARRVYGNNFAESVGDAGDAVAEIAKQLGVAADDPALQTMAENAFRLRDAFGVEVPESIDAVKTLMENFGLSSQEAFDYVAVGFQKGLNRSDDFLETITEYSNIFSGAGADADDFFSVIEQGSQGGVLGTDKAADAFKEFTLRVTDGSDASRQALDDIGVGADRLYEQISSGATTPAEAFQQVVKALSEIEDPIARQAAGVALLGTQYEDLTGDVVAAMYGVSEWGDMSEGAIDSLDAKYQTFGQAATAVWRKLVVAVAPLTDKLLELVNDAMPTVMQAFDWFEATALPAISGFGAVVGRVVGFVRSVFEGLGSTVQEQGTDRFAYFKEWIDTNLPLVQQIVERIMRALTGFWTEHGDAVMRIVGNAFKYVNLLFDTSLKTILDLVQFFLQVLTGDWEGAAETLQAIVQRLWDTVQEVFRLSLDSLKALFGEVDWAAVGSAIVNGIKDGIAAAWGGVVSWFQGKLADLRNLLPFSEPKEASSPLRGLAKSGRAIVEQLQSGIDSATLDLGGMGLRPLSATAGAGAGGPTVGSQYVITVNLTNGGYEEGREAGRGLVDEMRYRGMG